MNDLGTLAQSSRFRVWNEYEATYLRHPTGSDTVIGDFYGDPKCALIDQNEQWCVVGGAGLIVYRLQPPFDTYHYFTDSPQWSELGRSQHDAVSVLGIQQRDEDTVRILFELDPLPRAFDLNVRTMCRREVDNRHALDATTPLSDKQRAGGLPAIHSQLCMAITNDRQLARRAVHRFMTQRLGWSTPVLLTTLAGWISWDFLAGTWSGTDTVLGGAFAILTTLFLIYVVRLRAANEFLKRLGDHRVHYTFSETGVRTDSALGSSELKWSSFDEVLKFRDVWLLVYAKNSYLTLPTIHLSRECAGFIDKHVTGRETPID